MQLRLANLVVGLALRRKFVATMSIFNREVALLKTLTSFSRFIVSTDECLGWWGSIHDSRTSLSCLVVHAKSEVTRPQVFRLLRDLLTNVRVAGVSLQVVCVIADILVAVLLHGGERFIVTLESRVSNLNLMHVRGALLRVSVFLRSGGR